MRICMVSVVFVFLLIMTSIPVASAAPFQQGDVFAAVPGAVQHFDSNGNLLETLPTGFQSFTTGMAFDSAGNLYVTLFDGGTVIRFAGPGDPHTNLGVFGGPYSGKPESILFDATGNVYVGAVDGDNDVRKFDAAGVFLAQFNVPTEVRGSDWIDIDGDQVTLYYTSEGTNILRFDLQNNVALPNFNVAPLPGTAAFALRILPNPDCGVLVANNQMIVRLDSAGNQIQTYDVAGEDGWFALNLDPDGTSFWSGTGGGGPFSNNFYKFDINTGAVLAGPFNAGDGLSGLTVFGEITAANQIECPADITIECDESTDPSNTGEATAIGNCCDPEPVLTFADQIVSGTCPQAFTINRTWTATSSPECGGFSSSCVQVITAVDTTAPVLACPEDIVAECTGPEGAPVNFTVTAQDNCDAAPSVVCTDQDGNVVQSGDIFPVGITQVTCVSADACSNQSTCSFMIEVQDTTAPVVTCSVEKLMLWPPNHKLINVGLSVTVEDVCEPDLTADIAIFGDEDDEEAKGDGRHSPDAKDIAVGTLRLRSERKGNADGRVYLIAATVTDASGNVGVNCCTVVVPHSQNPAEIASVQAQAAAAEAFCEANGGTPPPGYFVVGDGDVIGPKQ